MNSHPRVEYQTDPTQYKHLKLSLNGAVATLAVDIDDRRSGLLHHRREGQADLLAAFRSRP